jgi:ribosomal protein L36
LVKRKVRTTDNTLVKRKGRTTDNTLVKRKVRTTDNTLVKRKGTSITRRYPLVEQELLTIPEHLNSPRFICVVRVVQL